MAKDEEMLIQYKMMRVSAVKIADEVVAIIASSCTEVDGVASMAGNITNEVIELESRTCQKA